MISTLQLSYYLQLKYIFGLNNDTRIIYPAGFHIVCYSLQDKSQSYFQGFEHYRGFSCMILSPMKRFLAAGVKGENLPFKFMTQCLKKKNINIS